MKKRFSAAAIIFLLLSFIVPVLNPVMAADSSVLNTVSGTVLYVDDDGLDYPNADFNKISDALTMANTGDRIIVYPGTYRDNLKIDKSISLEALNGPAMTTIAAVDAGSHVVEISAGNVKVQGFTVTGATGDKRGGFYLSEGSDNCLITGNVSAGNYSGLGIYKGYGNIVTNNTFRNNSYGMGLTEGANGTCAAEQAASLVDSVPAQEKEQVLDAFREFRDQNLKSTFREAYYKYSPLLSGVFLNRPDLALQAYRLMEKYKPAVQFSLQNNTASNLKLNAQDVEEISSFVQTIEGIVEKKYPAGDQDRNGLINTLDILGQQIGSFAGQDFSTAFQHSIYAAAADQPLKLQPQANSTSNYIYLNNFYQCTKDSVYADEWLNNYHSQYQLVYTYNGQQYQSCLGNYYDNYQERDSNGDGIGDSPYKVAGTSDSYDYYPAVAPYDRYALQFVKLSASALSGFTPLSVHFTAISPVTAARYHWTYIGTDGTSERTSNVNGSDFTFTKSGQYTVYAAAEDYLDNQISSNLVSISVVDPYYVDGPIVFRPYYPTRDADASVVMDGGSAQRCYRLLDQSNNPLRNVKFNYKFTGSDNIYAAGTDNAGYVYIESGIMHNSKDFRLEVLNPDNSIKQDVQNPPAFHVQVGSRSFSQEWSVLLGVRASGGVAGGPNVKIGTVKFETLKAGLEGGLSSSLSLRDTITGRRNDITLGNQLGTTLQAEGKAGLFGTMWKTKKQPTLDVGGTIGLKAGVQNGIQTNLEDFTNSSSPDHNKKVLAAGAVFLETALTSNPVTPVGSDSLMAWVLHKLDLANYQTLTSELSVEGNFSGNAKVSLRNPLGSLPGTENEIGLTGAEGSAVFSLGTGVDVDANPSKKTTTWSYTGELDFLSFETAMSKKFGDGRRKDTPKGALSLIESDSLINYEAKESIEVEKTGSNVSGISLVKGLPSNDDSIEQNFKMNLSADNISEILKTPGTLKDFATENKLYLAPNRFEQAYIEAVNLKNPVNWSKETSDVIRLPLSFDLELGLGLDAGLGLDGEYKSTTDYATEKGIFADMGQITLEKYDKDLIVAQQQQNLDNFLKMIKDSLSDAIKDSIQTVQNTAVKGAKLVKATVQGAWQNTVVSISRLIPQKSSYQVLVLPESAGEDQRHLQAIATKATTIGDVYIVNLQDENNALVTDFSAHPLNLTIEYTDEDLAAAGLTPDSVNHLAIYRWDGSMGYYVYQPSTVDRQNKQVLANIIEAGQYLLAVDMAGPLVTDFQVSNHTALPTISAIINDDLSGVDKSSFQFSMDNNILVTGDTLDDYFDPQSGLFKYIIESPLSSGEHRAGIYVKDSTGNIALVEPLIFTVNNSPPTIGHEPLTTAAAGRDLTITARITDDTGVAEARLFYKPENSGQNYQILPMTKAAGDGYTATIPKESVTANLLYYIQAKDIDGNVVDLQPLAVKLNGTAALAVTLTDPVSGGSIPPGDALTVIFNKEIVPGDNYAGITLKNNSTLIKANSVVAGNQLLILPIQPLQDRYTYSVEIPAGALQDVDGNTLTAPYHFSFMADRNAQSGDQSTIIHYPPQSNVAGNKIWTVTFSQELDPSLQLDNYVSVIDSQNNPVNVSLTYGSDGKSVIVSPAQEGYIPGGQYVLNISKGIKSKAGLLIAKSVRMQFQVSPD